MQLSAGFFDHLARQGSALLAAVRVRDGVHLGPALLNRAAAGRLRAGIRAVEAWLRRALLVLALSLEAGLHPPAAPYIKRARKARTGLRPWGLSVFTGEGAMPDFDALSTGQSPNRGDGRWGASDAAIAATPLITRLNALEALITAPHKRARRLAFYLARRRAGVLLAPGSGRTGVPARFGTEVSALYQALAMLIHRLGRARPPPLGPVPGAGPRIRRF